MYKRTTLFLLLGVILLVLFAGIAWWRAPYPQANRTSAIPLPTPPAIEATSLDTLLPPDSIRAIDNPQFINASKATGMAPETEARSLPHSSLHLPLNLAGTIIFPRVIHTTGVELIEARWRSSHAQPPPGFDKPPTAVYPKIVPFGTIVPSRV